MSLSKAILWPGTMFCKFFGVNPEGESGLMLRWVFNTMFYTAVGLIGVWIIVA